MTDGCYFAKDHHANYESFDDYLSEWQNADEDMNLIFRFDWKQPDAEARIDYHRLLIYYIMQRKAYPYSVRIKVTPDDEPRARKFLGEKWQHMKKLWTPLSIEKETQ
jgi:hypothetical protein